MVLDKKQKLLAGLLIVLAVMLTYRMARPFRQPTVAKLTYGRTNKIVSPAAETGDHHAPGRPTKVKTDLLAPPPRLDATVFRDPFQRPLPPIAERALNPADEETEPPETSPDERAREVLQRFKTFGSFGQGGRTSLFLQRGKQVLIINEGDRIDGQYKIDAIDGPSVLVSTPETETPFRFEFEELQSEDSWPPVSSSTSAPRLSPIPQPSPEPLPESEEDDFPPELEDDFAAEEDEDQPPSPLPEAPPVVTPDPPPTSRGSPSRPYLPGNRPSE